jgi:hypothetical protein
MFLLSFLLSHPTSTHSTAPTCSPNQSHRIVESTDAQTFGLDPAEVQERRRYVVYVRREIEVRWFMVVFAASRCCLHLTISFIPSFHSTLLNAHITSPISPSNTNTTLTTLAPRKSRT